MKKKGKEREISWERLKEGIKGMLREKQGREGKREMGMRNAGSVKKGSGKNLEGERRVKERMRDIKNGGEGTINYAKRRRKKRARNDWR